MKLAQLCLEQKIGLASAFDTIIDGVVVVNGQREVIFVNQAARSYFGIHEESGQMICPEDLPTIRALNGEEIVGQHLFLKNDEMPEGRFVSCNARALKHADVIVGAVMTFRDITETLLAEKVLEEQKAKMESAYQLTALGMMMAEIVHEIKNPLTAVSGAAWLLKKMLHSQNYSVPEMSSKVDEIQQMVEKINLIINSIRNASRDGSREEAGNHQLHSIINDVLAVCSAKFKQSRIRFSFTIDPSVPDHLLCRRIQLTQVMTNLLCNAIDAVESSASKVINLEVLTQNEALVIRVMDSGSGVPEGCDEKIFQTFYTTKDSSKGTGLGLSISKKLVEDNGGKLVLNRSVSNSCFEVRLPLSVRSLKAA